MNRMLFVHIMGAAVMLAVKVIDTNENPNGNVVNTDYPEVNFYVGEPTETEGLYNIVGLEGTMVERAGEDEHIYNVLVG